LKILVFFIRVRYLPEKRAWLCLYCYAKGRWQLPVT